MRGIFYVFVFGLLVSCGGNSEEVKLELNLKAGDSYTIATTTESKGGPADVSYSANYRFTVSDIKEDKVAYKVKASFEDNSNSDLFSDLDMQTEMDLLTKDTYSITLNKNGSIYENFTNGKGEPYDELVDMSNLQIQFPEHSVKEGSSWKVAQTPTLLGQKVEASYTVDEIGAEYIILDYVGKIEAGSFLGAMTKKGTYKIDRHTGVIIEGEFSSNMAMGGKAIFTFRRVM